jgi:hypothetical protein
MILNFCIKGVYQDHMCFIDSLSFQPIARPSVKGIITIRVLFILVLSKE